MGALSGLEICLTGFSFKEKHELKSKIQNHGGTYTYMITRTTDFLVQGNDNAETRVIDSARDLAIPVVARAFLDRSFELGKLANARSYLLQSETAPSAELPAPEVQPFEETTTAAPEETIIPDEVLPDAVCLNTTDAPVLGDKDDTCAFFLRLTDEHDVEAGGAATHGTMGCDNVTWFSVPCVDDDLVSDGIWCRRVVVPDSFGVRDVSCGPIHAAIAVTDPSCSGDGSTSPATSSVARTLGSGKLYRTGLASTQTAKYLSPVVGISFSLCVDRVACGRAHTIVACATGEIFGFGCNNKGQSGADPDLFSKVETARRISFESAGRVRSLSAGGDFSSLVTEHGIAYVWGDNQFGQLTVEPSEMSHSFAPVKCQFEWQQQGEFTAFVSCGYTHAAAVSSAGSLVTWGSNTHGELGRGSKSHHGGCEFVPELCCSRVECGNECTIVSTHEKNGVYGFGSCADGRLGIFEMIGDENSAQNDFMTPTRISAFDDMEILSISCGDMHGALVNNIGEIWLWGKMRCISSDRNKACVLRPFPLPRVSGAASVTCDNSGLLILVRGATHILGKLCTEGDHEMLRTLFSPPAEHTPEETQDLTVTREETTAPKKDEAAVKIQKTYKGHRARKKVSEMKNQNARGKKQTNTGGKKSEMIAAIRKQQARAQTESPRKPDVRSDNFAGQQTEKKHEYSSHERIKLEKHRISVENLNRACVQDYYPLHLCSLSKVPKCIEVIFECDKDMVVEIDSRTANGLTALHLAVAAPDVTCTVALLANGADASARAENSNDTPLHVACSVGNTDCIRALLEWGGDKSLTNTAKETPLHVAARLGHIGASTLLVTGGARLHGRDRSGGTPVSYLESEAAKSLQVVASQTDIFLSYAHKDASAARKMRRILEAFNLRVWLDEWCLQAGCNWRASICSGVVSSAALLFLASSKSVLSPWCTKEIAVAAKFGKPIVVVRLEDFSREEEEATPVMLNALQHSQQYEYTKVSTISDENLWSHTNARSLALTLWSHVLPERGPTKDIPLFPSAIEAPKSLHRNIKMRNGKGRNRSLATSVADLPKLPRKALLKSGEGGNSKVSSAAKQNLSAAVGSLTNQKNSGNVPRPLDGRGVLRGKPHWDTFLASGGYKMDANTRLEEWTRLKQKYAYVSYDWSMRGVAKVVSRLLMAQGVHVWLAPYEEDLRSVDTDACNTDVIYTPSTFTETVSLPYLKGISLFSTTDAIKVEEMTDDLYAAADSKSALLSIPSETHTEALRGAAVVINIAVDAFSLRGSPQPAPFVTAVRVASETTAPLFILLPTCHSTCHTSIRHSFKDNSGRTHPRYLYLSDGYWGLQLSHTLHLLQKTEAMERHTCSLTDTLRNLRHRLLQLSVR
eukprot:Rmarinus@m.28861